MLKESLAGESDFLLVKDSGKILEQSFLKDLEALKKMQLQ